MENPKIPGWKKQKWMKPKQWHKWIAGMALRKRVYYEPTTRKFVGDFCWESGQRVGVIIGRFDNRVAAMVAMELCQEPVEEYSTYTSSQYDAMAYNQTMLAELKTTKVHPQLGRMEGFRIIKDNVDES